MKKCIKYLNNTMLVHFVISTLQLPRPTVISSVLSQGSRVRPNLSMVRLKKIRGRTCATSHSREKKSIREREREREG